MLQLEGKTDKEKQKVLLQLQSDLHLAEFAASILNVLIIQISREAILFRQWFVLETASQIKAITGNLI